MKARKIIFQGDELFLLDDSIGTEDQIRNGYSSYAHIFDDGIIRRHSKIIGTRNDIEFLEELELDIDLLDLLPVLFNMRNGVGWPE